MIPILFPVTDINVNLMAHVNDISTGDYSSGHGIGDLVNCLKCEATSKSSGEYELEIEYPSDDELADKIERGSIIIAAMNHWQDPQIWRVYTIEKKIDPVLTIKAEHISYDLARVPIQHFGSNVRTIKSGDTEREETEKYEASVIFNWINTHKDRFVENPFTFSTDVDDTEKMPGWGDVKSIRKLFFDGDDSIVGSYGGDVIFDNYTVSHKQTGGQNRGAIIEYGIDMIDFTLSDSASEMITGVLPFITFNHTSRDSSTEVEIEDSFWGDIQSVDGSFGFHSVVPLDMGKYFPEAEWDGDTNVDEHSEKWGGKNMPSKSELNAKAREWIAKADIGKPKFEMTVGYADTGKDIRLFDQVQVKFPKRNVDVSAKVTEYKYDVLLDRPISITCGNTDPSSVFKLDDASKLKKGLLPPERIRKRSVTSDKISDGAVINWKIDTGAVTDEKVADKTLSGGKLKDYTIDASKLKEWTQEDLNRFLKDRSISMDKLGDDVVTYYYIDDEPKRGIIILDGSITEEKLQDLCVGYSKLQDGAISTEYIPETREYISPKLGTYSVLTDKMALQSVVMDTLADDIGSVISDMVIANQIISGQIWAGSIGAFEISSSKISLLPDKDDYYNPGGTLDVSGGTIQFADAYKNASYAEIDDEYIYQFAFRDTTIEGRSVKVVCLNNVGRK